MDGYWTYHGDPLIVYANVQSLCGIPEINIVLNISYISYQERVYNIHILDFIYVLKACISDSI